MCWFVTMHCVCMLFVVYLVCTDHGVVTLMVLLLVVMVICVCFGSALLLIAVVDVVVGCWVGDEQGRGC